MAAMSRWDRSSRLASGVLLVLPILCAGAACTKQQPVWEVSGGPEFDRRWAELAAAGVEISYVADDRGEALMGSVRRASRAKAEPLASMAAVTAKPGTLPEHPPGEQVQRIIRGNLTAVRGCFLSMARTGQARSGKAIVSFSVGADGKAADLTVDAPAFAGTPLPGCVTAQVSHWEFPKSQRGGSQVSYPFVFVSG